MNCLARIVALDERLLMVLVRRRCPRLTRAMRVCTSLGNVPVLIGTTCLLVALPATRGVGAAVAVAMLVSQGLVFALKALVVRPRPTSKVTPLCVVPSCHSFPSGHSSGSMAFALATLPYLGLWLMPLAVAVGASRAYLGVHYPSDVAAGWGIGCLSGILALQLLL
jgi:undecaprenyl-diphosphatase